ncbi:MAG: hypothetical protein COW55_14585 [Rhodobacteraceae bacterium CG17_big_fil_post_rev_8_21_14_2_50_65_11]|nr:MAG: hypothetical protein COW55_14585 [Rhodobacteraceae bacterium CG17_big_fil_post_rev_8_21_14_2_50_65_11]
MKKLTAAATALTIVSTMPALADEAAPVMDIEIVTQNTSVEPTQADVLVPILMMTFMALTAS